MKKTFSLKLMLLGLLIGFGSMTAFAGDFFTNGGFVFEKVPGGVKVAGVTKLSTTGVLTIGTKYMDSQDPDDVNGYNVVAIADIDVPVIGKRRMKGHVEGDTFTAEGSGKIKLVGEVNFTLKGEVSGDNLHIHIDSNKGEFDFEGVRI